MISLYKMPNGEKTYCDYKIILNGMPVQAITCRISSIPCNAI